jgi:mRNA-degrading endonuclease RelE of RelBE toxin-antitoxin system
MIYELFYTETAIAEINKILNGIEKRLSKKIADDCRRKIEHTVLLVESNPFIG